MQITCKDRPLTAKEQIFCNEYIANLHLEQSDRIRKACEVSGCTKAIFNHEAVQKEIESRIQSINDSAVMSAKEILEMYSKIARGAELDQFGLEASLDTRLKALDSLAKRICDQKDIDNKFEIHLIRD